MKNHWHNSRILKALTVIFGLSKKKTVNYTGLFFCMNVGGLFDGLYVRGTPGHGCHHTDDDGKTLPVTV